MFVGAPSDGVIKANAEMGSQDLVVSGVGIGGLVGAAEVAGHIGDDPPQTVAGVGPVERPQVPFRNVAQVHAAIIPPKTQVPRQGRDDESGVKCPTPAQLGVSMFLAKHSGASLGHATRARSGRGARTKPTPSRQGAVRRSRVCR